MTRNIFGYFDNADQSDPVFDPGLGVKCPYCNRVLERPVVTVSLMVPDDGRSYFYRAHKACSEQADDEVTIDIESALVDVIWSKRLSSGPTPTSN